MQGGLVLVLYWSGGLRGQAPSIRNTERKAGKGFMANPTLRNLSNGSIFRTIWWPPQWKENPRDSAESSGSLADERDSETWSVRRGQRGKRMAVWGENSMVPLRCKNTHLTGRTSPHVLLLNLKDHAVTAAFHGCCPGMGLTALSMLLLSRTGLSEQGRICSQCHKLPEGTAHWGMAVGGKPEGWGAILRCLGTVAIYNASTLVPAAPNWWTALPSIIWRARRSIFVSSVLSGAVLCPGSGNTGLVSCRNTQTPLILCGDHLIYMKIKICIWNLPFSATAHELYLDHFPKH